MKKIIVFIVACSTLFLAGCATTRQSVPIPNQTKMVENPGLARIYVVRPTGFGSAISMRIIDNGKYIGNTGPKGYLCWERQPGSAEISSKAENTSTVTLNAESGEVYYICQHIQLGVVAARNKLEIVSKEQGQKYLKKCKPPVLKQ
jgi:hypothetical protein